jgi:effector-binding domain-containing protein
MLKAALEFEIVDLPEETFAFVVRRVAPDEVGEFIDGALGRVAEFAAGHGGPQGPPMAITTAPDELGSLVVEAGWPVGSSVEPAAPVEVRTLPATRALRHLYAGPYEELGSGLYADLYTAAHEQGLTPTSAPRERYLNDPATGREPLTEIVWPLS